MIGHAGAAAFLDRLEAVLRRLQRHAASAAPPEGLTDPDVPSGERWEWGQVWAHLGEFVPYWVGQVRLVVDARSEEPVPFGRTKADPARIEAIERDRHRSSRELMDRLARQADGVRRLLRGLSPEDRARRGLHPTLGVMEVPKMVDEFLVGHLEQHADQLDGLASRRSSADR